MRILIIWGESLSKPGGGTAHCHGLVQGLQRSGHAVSVIAPAYRDLPKVSPGKSYYFVPLGRRSLWSFFVFQAISVLWLLFWLARFRPQAVYVRTCFLQGIQAILTRLAGVPLVGEVDSIVDAEIRSRGEPDWWNPLVRSLDRFNFRLSEGSVCVTEKLRREVVRRGGRAERTVHIPNGASVDLFRPMDREEARRQFPALPPRGFVVGFAGTFAPWIGLDLLFETARRLADSHPEIRFAIMGDGQMAPEVRRWAAETKLSQTVILLPRSPREKVAVFLNACNVSVMPFHHEGILRYGLSSLKFWDAVSVALPVLVPHQADLGHVLKTLNLPGEYESGNPKSLAEAIVRIAMNGKANDSLRREIHEKVSEQYSWDAVARTITRFLDSL
jgi:glycosyltransferase involved in cell wall biosynthesis